MNKLKKVFLYLKSPSIWFAAVIWAIFLGLFTVTMVFLVRDLSTEIYAIIIDAITLPFLIYAVYLSVVMVPKINEYIKNGPSKNYRVNKFLSDYNYRAIVFAALSFLTNAAFAGLQLTLSFFTRSPWLFSFGIYYLILAVLRWILVHINRVGALTERMKMKLYGQTGIFITSLGLVIIPIVYMAYLNMNIMQNYGQILAIGSALYTFIKVVLAIHNVNKVRKKKDYYLQAIKNVSFVDALVSIFSLELTMLAVFSENQVSNISLNIATGSVSCLIITGMGIYMIVNSYRQNKATIIHEDKRIDKE